MAQGGSHLFFVQAGFGAGNAGLGAVEAGFDAIRQRITGDSPGEGG